MTSLSKLLAYLSVRPSVTTRYRSKTRQDRDFEFLPKVSSISWQNFMPLGKGGPFERGGEKGASLFKKTLF